MSWDSLADFDRQRGRGEVIQRNLLDFTNEGVFEIIQFVFFNWDSLHARLNSHYEAWSYKEKKHKKDYSIQETCLERTYS